MNGGIGNPLIDNTYNNYNVNPTTNRPPTAPAGGSF